MDRNITALAVLLMYNVALRKESVDRNEEFCKYADASGESLSARRAWIEISKDIDQPGQGKGRSPQGERG